MKKKQQKFEKKEERAKEDKEADAFLPCLEVNLIEPLTKFEWVNWLKVIDETQGLGWIQILPVGQKSS